ncbi:hypothetical protein [Burkholderia ubonensis]|uniref:hypothetical protein n=1 Tax=Burkholderia ubonensis TaxID=101571 RepID=UPI0007551FD6|nr:hypothetical protein [Burkholderia ubonensis]KVC78078.1 hypothetical protein WI75_13600 [Burkholderia ubonensis]KVL69450.1 hypothetical protein WJ48_11865 [Burkholderia ubonensis]KVL77286.1 hypothetical protein WJ49_09915 [Burkholderia ubonensis]KVM00547.1 hypothetical protein WJ50_32460 [Burkholderia ubonensis]KVZ52238.1 hypothetical protein WL18_04320 [Burkholderia ubonensis]
MKKTLSFALIIGALLFGVALAAHYWSPHSTPDNGSGMNSLPTRIRLGDSKDSDFNGPGSSIDNHPSGMNFYQHDWARGNLGTVEFVHGKHSFVIDNVLSVMGIADKDVPEGIYEWKVNFGVSPEQADTHEAALARMTRLLSDLRTRGWARYVDIGYPRLTGRQAWDYLKINDEYSLDSGYTPTIEEWKAVVRKMPKWTLYSDGVYLEVSLMESNMGGFVGKTTYLLSIHLKSEYAYYGLGYFAGESEKIKNWKALLPAELQKYHVKRIETEATLKAQGYTIDTAYQDPPIRALQGSSANPQ